MKFTLLVANYNNGKYFKDCYQSIINQTFQDFQVIILDDASTDNSLEIIRKLIKNDSRFQLHLNESNRGIGYTKRKLVELSQGEISAFLDPDDTISSDALEVMFKMHEKYPKAAGVYSRFQYCDENLNPTFIQKRKYYWVASYNKYFFNFDHRILAFFSFKTKIYRQTTGINPNYMIAEDQDMYLKLYEKGPLKFVNKILYNYRRHEKGVTKDMNRTKLDYSQVLWDTIKRRGIKKINGVEVNENTDLFKLLEYQDKIPYKIREIISYFLFG